MIYAEWIDDLQRVLPEGVPGWAVLAAAGFLAILVVGGLIRRLLRWLFGGRNRSGDWDRDLRLNLDDCPLPTAPPGDYRLTVYHLPVRLRLVVLAPLGKDGEVDVLMVEKVLDRAVPGLGGIAGIDRPWIRVWPAQVSHHGFMATFHRNTPKAAGKGELSRWVLVAGRAQVGRQTVLLGLGLWADEPNTLDRLILEPHQWLDVLRLRESNPLSAESHDAGPHPSDPLRPLRPPVRPLRPDQTPLPPPRQGGHPGPR